MQSYSRGIVGVDRALRPRPGRTGGRKGRAVNRYGPRRPWLRCAPVAPLTTEQILALLAPIVVIQLGLMIVALHDLEQEERHVRGGSKLVWRARRNAERRRSS